MKTGELKTVLARVNSWPKGVVTGMNYLNIQSLDVRNTNGNAILFDGWSPGWTGPNTGNSNITISGVTAQYAGANGIKIDTATGAISANDVIQNCIAAYNLTDGIEAGGNVQNILIQGNIVHNNATNPAVDFLAGIRVVDAEVADGSLPTTPTNVVVQNNLVYSNGIGTTGNRGVGIHFDTLGAGAIMRYNVLHDNPLYGLLLEWTPGGVVEDNFAYDNGVGAFLGRRNQGSMLFNNTLYNNAVNIEVQGDGLTTPMSNNIIENNIIFGGTKQLSATTGGENDGVNGSGNSYLYNDFGPATTNFITWGLGNNLSTYSTWETATGNCGTPGCSHSVESDPLFTNPAGSDFTLQSTSPAINGGVNLGSTYQLGLAPGSTWPSSVSTLNQNTNGLGWDIGAYVYTETTAPTVSLTAPASGATVSGSSVAISANASDNSAVAGVQFKLDTNANIGVEDTSSPYGATWNSTGVADGSHTIIAVARDTYGNYATSTPITVTVHNAVASSVGGSSGGGGWSGGCSTYPQGEVPSWGVVPCTPTNPSQGHAVLPGTQPSPTPTSSPPSVQSQGSTPSTEGITLSKNHQLWDKGEDIRALQKFFNAHGFIIAATGPGSPGSETSIFGSKTYQALKKFQKANNLPPTGFLGPLTRAALASVSATSTTQ
jgi:hypothetical protein